MIRTNRRAMIGAGLASPFLGRGALAQAWPTRPVRFIVSFAAGGAADTVARAFGARLGEILGQSIVVENRTGGNALVAANATLQAPADGYTFLVDAANQVTNPRLMANLPFDYRTAFAPIAQFVNFPQVVAVKQDFPARTIQEYIAHARANPATVSYGTPPTAGTGHLAGELLQQRAGIRLIHAGYRGGADAARDIAAGSVDSVIITTSSVRPPVAAGRARVLAVTSAARTAAFPDAPTLIEVGMEGFDISDWSGLFAAASTPRPIIERVSAAVMEAARDEGVRGRLGPLGAEMVGSSMPDFAAFLERQRVLLTKVIDDGNITIS
ncbi:Bug family tripartite tricarboxylate transporter substrate binding protein [Muricoccus radiodurans]|uniref:Bug family tripartite tricarboxylate transporter substrate binding protein n=1 Tax=Muricoccus radiodurans TaxID=2231721 RepID=UPI003CEB5CB7